MRIRTITIEREGKTYTGEFRVEKGMVAVTTEAGGYTSTQLGASPADSVARLLLSELVREGKA